ncbi:MAG TPA: ATP-binding protein [Burkholderiales bacterium]
MPPRAISIRALLLAGIGAVLLVVLGPAAWLSYSGSEEEAQELFDARLATSARVLEALVARQLERATIAAPIVLALPAPLESYGHDQPGPLGHYYETKIAFQVRDAAGRLLARSASAHEAPFAPLEAGFSTRPIAEWSWRVFSLRSGEVWIQVAERDDVRDEMSQKIAFAAAAPLLAGIPLILVLVTLLVRRGLTPLSELVRQVAARQPGSVEPLALVQAPAEISPLVDALNGLLERVRAALERERRFTADAAHELRTPLAALKVHAQNAVRASSAEEREASLQRMLQGLERTVHLAEQMLAYSRAANSAQAPGSVRLLALLGEAVEAIRPLAQERGAKVNVVAAAGLEALAVRGERHQLLSLVTNLLDNAIRYGPPGGRVEVSLGLDGDGAVLGVADQGPGIPPGLRERIFESYYRIPGSGGAGSGLGLSIVKEIAEAHGARVEVHDGPGGRGTRIVVRFAALERHAPVARTMPVATSQERQ